MGGEIQNMLIEHKISFDRIFFKIEKLEIEAEQPIYHWTPNIPYD